MHDGRARQNIQRLKELPALAPDLARIVESCENPDIDFRQLARVLHTSPTICARLLGLANSAFFGQKGKVESLEAATAILGLSTVRGIATAMALAGNFQVDRCRGFDPKHYWLTAILTAEMAQELRAHTAAALGPSHDGVYLAGLLHNFGLLALVHLFPDEMSRAFAAYAANPNQRLDSYVHGLLAITQHQAGAWIGGKWHLPTGVLLVMEHHHNHFYRGELWPLVHLVGYCARRIADALKKAAGAAVGNEKIIHSFLLMELGIDSAAAASVEQHTLVRLSVFEEAATHFVAWNPCRKQRT